MAASSNRISAQAVSEGLLGSKLQFMIDIHLWPTRPRLDHIQWLNNFLEPERPYALNLLNVFIYFNDALIDALLRSVVHNLSTNLTSAATSWGEAKTLWQDYLSEVKISYVEGEDPNVTDSGIVFARKARQILEIDQNQIVTPQLALEELMANPKVPILLLDDFIGGGGQTSSTWHRSYKVGANRNYSFELAAQSGASIIYAPLIATTAGMESLALDCPELSLKPAHVLDASYSLTGPDCVLWPDALQPTASDFIHEASKRAGIVDECEFGWEGFHDLLPRALNR